MTKNNLSSDIKRHIGVLKEHFDDKVDIIAEQYGSIQKRLDEHSQQFVLIRNELEVIKIGLRHKVDYGDFEALEKRVKRIEEKIKVR